MASGSGTNASSSGGSGSASGSNIPMDTQKFLAFAETHRTVLNQILRQSTVHLADGPFSVLVDHTRVLDFDIKRRYESMTFKIANNKTLVDELYN